METVKIKSIFINATKKDGTPYVGQYGPFSIAVLTTEDGRKMSKFVKKSSDPVNSWKPGMEVDIVVEEKDGYMNFDIPDETDELVQRVAELEEWKLRVASFLNVINEILHDQIKEHDAKKLSKNSL